MRVQDGGSPLAALVNAGKLPLPLLEQNRHEGDDKPLDFDLSINATSEKLSEAICRRVD